MSRHEGSQGGGWPSAARGRAAEIERTPALELDLLIRDLGRKLDAEIVVLYGTNDGGRSPELVSSWGTRVPDERLALPEKEGLVGRVLEGGQAVVGPLDPAADAAFIEVAGRALTHALAVPVDSPSGRNGALCACFSKTPADEPPVSLWVTERYARLIALCLHDPGVFEQLLVSAHHDHLTGCLNYASVRDELTTEIKRSSRHELALSCCFIDLDGFKRVNDHFGHLYGNGVLAGVGESLRQNVRSFDTVGRYGGDEFVVILPETSRDQARVLAERLRGCVRATVLPSGEPLEASVGIAQWRPGSSAEEMITAADQALLIAKRTGAAIVAADELRPKAVSTEPVDHVA